jgi:hypothetical protein
VTRTELLKFRLLFLGAGRRNDLGASGSTKLDGKDAGTSRALGHDGIARTEGYCVRSVQRVPSGERSAG